MRRLGSIFFIFCISLISFSFVFYTLTFAADPPGTISNWGQTTVLGQNADQMGSAAYNGYIYRVAGLGTDGKTTYYAKTNSDGTIGSWTASPNTLPVEGLYGLRSLAYNGYLYAIGGRIQFGTNKVYYAAINPDGSIGSWAQAANSMPYNLYTFNAIVYGGYLYIIGGDNGNGWNRTVLTAQINTDGSVGTWTTIANSLPDTGGQGNSGAASVVFNDYVYYMGGNVTPTKVLSAPLGANGYIGSWTEQTGSPIPGGANGPGYTIDNGYIFLFGGFTSGNAFSDKVYSAPLKPNGEIGAWVEQTALPVANARSSSVAWNHYLYVIGGATTGWLGQNTVYYTQVNGAYPPDAPTSLGATSMVDGSYIGSNQPTFSFSQSDPNVDGTTVQYEIQIDDTSNFSSPVVDYTSAFGAEGSTSFVVGQAAGSGTYTTGSSGQTLSGGNYYWQVKTINSFEVESSYTQANSGAIAFRIDATDPSVPGDPSTTTPTTDSTPSWTWTDSSDTGSGLAVTPYSVQWSQDEDFITGVSSSASSTASFTHSIALSVGTWYFQVKAADTAGNESAYSNAGSVVIQSPPATPTPTTSTPSSNSSPSPSGSPSCTVQAPTSAPELFQIRSHLQTLT